MAEEDQPGLLGAFSARLQAILRPWNADDDNVQGLTRTYASGLYIVARGLSSKPDDPLDDLAKRVDLASKESPDLRDIFALELELARLLPPEMRERRYWEYRTRFERVASPQEFAAYLASSPPPPPSAVSAISSDGSRATPIGDADNLVLLGHVHRNYLVTVLREQAERDLKHWIQKGLMRGLILYGLLLALLLVLEFREMIPEQALYFGVGLSLFFLVGRLGAATSVVQRLQKAVREEGKDAFFEVTALCTGRRGISIAMMEGGIFAVLLYIIFAAGLGQNLGMSGGIFPQVEVNSPADRAPDSGAEAGDALGRDTSDEVERANEEPAQRVRPAERPAEQGSARTNAFGWETDTCDSRAEICMPTFISQIGKHLGFRDYPDFFKMLLLAFLAGFAERLVPDALDRLIQRRGAVTDNVAPAVAAGSGPPPKAPVPIVEVSWDGPAGSDSAAPPPRDSD